MSNELISRDDMKYCTEHYGKDATLELFRVQVNNLNDRVKQLERDATRLPALG